jgi:hypothetical protein
MTTLSQYHKYYRLGLGEVLGPAYRPAMMQFDGSTGYYNLASAAISGNSITLVAKFNVAQVLDTSTTALLSTSSGLIAIYMPHNSNTETEMQNKIKIICRSTSADVCVVGSTVDVMDGQDHTLLFAYDGTAGTAAFYIDGVDVDDTGYSSRLVGTGTLTTTSGIWRVGAAHWDASLKIDGKVGFFGVDDQYLTTYSDFFDANDNPIDQDETTWANSGWGAQPLFWNEHGQMSNNKGSAGNMTENGTIIVAPAEVLA